MKTPKVGDVVQVYQDPTCQDSNHPIPVSYNNESFGLAYPVRNGQPLNGFPQGHLIHRDTEGVCRIVAEVGHGPAQVATKEYRDGWDRTFSVN